MPCLTSGRICCGLVFGIVFSVRQKKKTMATMKSIVNSPDHSSVKSFSHCMPPQSAATAPGLKRLIATLVSAVQQPAGGDAKKSVASSRSATAMRSSALWMSGEASCAVIVALREEAVGDALGERVAERPRVGEAGEDRRDDDGVRARSPRPSRVMSVHERRLDRRGVADDLLDELDPVAVVAEHLGDAPARDLLAEPGRDAAVDLDDGLRRDDVDLLRGVDLASARA